MEILLALCIGMGLSAACGFRLFVPPLMMSAAAVTGSYELPAELAWMGTEGALIAFAAATAVEVLAYYIPWIDNLLDAIEVPLAAIAGTFLTAGMLSDAVLASFPEFSPLMLWTAAAIAGGGTLLSPGLPLPLPRADWEIPSSPRWKISALWFWPGLRSRLR